MRPSIPLHILLAGLALAACWGSSRGGPASDVTSDGDMAAEPDIASDPVAEIDLEPDEPIAGTGFFDVARRDGRWWLVTPDGQPFYSTGVNHVSPAPNTDRESGECPYCQAVEANYESEVDWSDGVVERLESWGFNTIGAWSKWELFSTRMPYTVILGMSGADWLTGVVPDYFSADFEARCATIAGATVAPLRDDRNLVGWFIDNELRWGPDHRSTASLLEDYLSFPEGTPGRRVAESYDGDAAAFLRALADRFFEVTTTAIREADPNHLVLGVRSISLLTPYEVVEAAGDWLDVFSVNSYVFNPGFAESIQTIFDPVVPVGDWLSEFYEVSQLPLLITEFSFRAADSGLPNSSPPIYPVLDTQQDRADAFEDYVRNSYAAPYVVGHHWFEYADQPAGGRFDGEDSNFGLVGTDDQVWGVLTTRMVEVHADAPHRSVEW